MREPYETFFDGYSKHWMLGRHLQGDEPDFLGIAADPRLDDLSTGEKVLVDFAAAYANALTYLDDEHLRRVELALLRVLI